MSDKKQSMKIIFLGESDVGKTALLNQYHNCIFNEYSISTIGTDYFCKKLSYQDTEVIIHYFDTSGQEKYRSMPRNYFLKVDGVALVFDLTNKNSFEKIFYWYRKITESVSLDNIQFVLIGNKCDKVKERVIDQKSIDVLMSFIQSCTYFETSAKKGINVNECFHHHQEQILRTKEIFGIEKEALMQLRASAQIKRKKKCLK